MPTDKVHTGLEDLCQAEKLTDPKEERNDSRLEDE